MSEQGTTKDQVCVRFHELVPTLRFNDEDIGLVANSYPHLIRLDAAGWLDMTRARELRDWLNRVIPS